MITCPSCHKKSKAGKTCSRCGIPFEQWLSSQISLRTHQMKSQSFFSKQSWWILIFGIAVIIGASKAFDFIRTHQLQKDAATLEPIENLDTPEKILMELARRSRDKSASLEELKARLKEFDLPTTETQSNFPSQGKDQYWSNGLTDGSDPKNLVRGRDWQGRKSFEIDNRPTKRK